MPRVLNRRDWPKDANLPENSIYIGRANGRYRLKASKWGNPYLIDKHGPRDLCVYMHRVWLPTQPDLLASVHELRGKDLVCWCHPEPCHGTLLLALANREGGR